MTSDELLEKVALWRQELESEVIAHFRADSPDQGWLTFERWKESVSAYLEEHAPKEAERFSLATWFPMGFALDQQDPYPEFMEAYGKACLAFLAELEDAASKGRVNLVERREATDDSYLSGSEAAVPPDTSVRDGAIALDMIHSVRRRIDKKAERDVRRLLLLAAVVVVTVWAFLAAFAEGLGMNMLRPFFYSFGVLFAVMVYAYFLATLREPGPKAIYTHLVESRKKKLYRELGFDLYIYEQLGANES